MRGVVSGAKAVPAGELSGRSAARGDAGKEMREGFLFCLQDPAAHVTVNTIMTPSAMKYLSLIGSAVLATLSVSCQQQQVAQTPCAPAESSINRCRSCNSSSATSSSYVGDLADHYRFCPACPEQRLEFRTQPGT